MTHQLTIAVATMDMGIGSYKIPNIVLNESISLLIIHQISHKSKNFDFSSIYQKLKESHDNIKVITANETGLSKSRNLAIKNCATKYIVFSDDDNDYVEDLSSLITRYHIELGEPEFMSFQIHDKNGEPFKEYSDQLKPHDKMSAMRLSSIESVVNCDYLKSNNIYFDESFGLGAKYPSCEQPIFLANILDNGGKAFYIPSPFAIHPKENTGLDFYSKDNALTRGKMLIKVFGSIKGRILTVAFMMKKIRTVPKGMRIIFIKGLLDL